MELLDEKLKTYAKSNIYPFHMPGHKRRRVDEVNPYSIDITEIDGFDNLHHATEILKEAQMRAANLYQARQSYYLVNGSTCGLLAAISASCPKRSRILVARNCHKAVYHAIDLQELQADYLYPNFTSCGICGQITPRMVEEAITKEVEQKNGCPYKAVVITSPTYDGVVSDIAGIAAVAHRYGILLIVDEAHGAHFGLSRYFPKSAVTEGADLVIQSLHKTLPSYTQTALLHVCSERVPLCEIERQLDIFETSSPSYVLMAGMERCIQLLSMEKEALFESYWEKLEGFYDRVKTLKMLQVIDGECFLQEEAFAFDPSKLLIVTKSLSGKELYDCLLHKYGLQMEMVSRDYVLGMTSIMDTEEGFERLWKALHEIDTMLEAKASAGKEQPYIPYGNLYEPAERVMTIARAQEQKKEQTPLLQASGCVSGDYVYLYPPGIPLVAPGERITDKILSDIESCRRLGLKVLGVADGKMCTLVF